MFRLAATGTVSIEPLQFQSSESPGADACPHPCLCRSRCGTRTFLGQLTADVGGVIPVGEQGPFVGRQREAFGVRAAQQALHREIVAGELAFGER